MDEDFILTKLALEELKSLGYTEAWIGNVPNPHWEHGMGDGIVVSPKTQKWGWPSIWTASHANFGSMGCGNGLRLADQCQRQTVRRMIPGHYVLVDDSWLPGNNQDLGVSPK